MNKLSQRANLPKDYQWNTALFHKIFVNKKFCFPEN